MQLNCSVLQWLRQDSEQTHHLEVRSLHLAVALEQVGPPTPALLADRAVVEQHQVEQIHRVLLQLIPLKVMQAVDLRVLIYTDIQPVAVVEPVVPVVAQSAQPTLRVKVAMVVLERPLISLEQLRITPVVVEEAVITQALMQSSRVRADRAAVATELPLEMAQLSVPVLVLRSQLRKERMA